MEETMKNLTFIICMLLVVFLSVNAGFSQAVAEDEKEAGAEDEIEKKEQPQTKPAKQYDLTPKFLKGMKWKETIKISMTMDSQGFNRIMQLDATSNVKITEMKNNKPSKIKFSDFKGTMRTESSFGGEEPAREDTDELKSITMEFGVTDDYQLTVDGKLEYNIREMMLVYPDGNILGFMPAKKAVKVGDTWDSDSLIPINIKILESDNADNVIYSNLKSKFKLDKVETTKKIEIAFISWTGKCNLAPEGEINDSLSIAWERTIKFDLTNNRVISTDGTICMSMDESMTIDCTTTRSLEYGESKPKKEEPKIKPKNDDEE